MKPIDLVRLSEKIAQFSAERDWDKFHSPKNLAMALSVEVAELAEIYQWLTEDESRAAHEDEALRSKIADELADISIYLIRLFQKTGIDLEKAVLTKLSRNGEKYPVELAKGKSTKYTDL